MAYTYVAGSATPGYSGLIDCNGIRMGSADPGATFKLSDFPFAGSAPVRLAVDALPSDSGAVTGPQFFDAWQFTLPGWLYVPTGPDDVYAAQEQLKATFAASNGLLALTLNTRAWPAARLITARLNGQIVFTPRHQRLAVPTRDFTIPMVAPNPIISAAAATTAPIALGGSGTLTTLTNNGDAPAILTVRFTGPITDPQFVLNVGPLYPQIAMLGTTIASGDWVEVRCDPTVDGGATAVDNTGANRYDDVTALTVMTVAAGASQWFVSGSGTSGATGVSATFADSWG